MSLSSPLRWLCTCALLLGATGLAGVETHLPGDPKFEVRLQGIYVAAGELEPMFEPDLSEYNLTITHELATKTNFTLMLNLAMYDPLHCPEVAVNGKVLDYSPLEPILAPIDIGESIGPIEKDIRITVSDPSHGGFLGGHPKSKEYVFHLRKPPQYERLTRAALISVTDSLNHVVESDPPMSDRALHSNRFDFPLAVGVDSVTVEFQCPTNKGIGWKLDGTWQQGTGGKVTMDVTMHYKTRKVFSCLYMNSKWTSMVPEHSYQITVSKHMEHKREQKAAVALKQISHLATAQLRVIPTFGYCVEVPAKEAELGSHPLHVNTSGDQVVAKTGFVCRVNARMSHFVATFSSMDGAVPDVFLINEHSHAATQMPNAVPADVEIAHERQYFRLNVEVAAALVVYPVVTIWPGDCSEMKCGRKKVNKPKDQFSAAENMCQSETCGPRDEEHCCIIQATCSSYGFGCPEGESLVPHRDGLCRGAKCTAEDRATCCIKSEPEASPAPPFSLSDSETMRATTTMTTTTTTTTMLCMQRDEVWLPIDMKGAMPTIEDDYQACQARCAAKEDCAHFSFWVREQHCHLQDANARKQDYGYGFESGPPVCFEENRVPTTTTDLKAEDRCRQQGILWEPAMQGPLFFDAPDEEEGIRACQQKCALVQDCGHFQYDTVNRLCNLAGPMARPYPTVLEAASIVSGPPSCDGVYHEMSEFLLMQYRREQAAREEQRAATRAPSSPVSAAASVVAPAMCVAGALAAMFFGSRRTHPRRASEMSLITQEAAEERASAAGTLLLE